MRQLMVRPSKDIFWSVLTVAAAWVGTLGLYRIYPPLRQHGHYAFFLAAIAISAWQGGFFRAIVTIALSSLTVAWMMPPNNSLRIGSPEDVIRLSLFTALGLFISYLHHNSRRAEVSLEESEHRLRFSLDSSGVACWDANIKTGTFWKSHNLPAIYGRSESDFATTYEGFFAYIHPEDRGFFHLADVEAAGSQRDYEIAHRIVAADGEARRVKTRGRMYMDETGRVVRMVGAVYRIDVKRAMITPMQPSRAPGAEAPAQTV
jgi:PAS domain-containing protein